MTYFKRFIMSADKMKLLVNSTCSHQFFSYFSQRSECKGTDFICMCDKGNEILKLKLVKGSSYSDFNTYLGPRDS